MMAWYVFALVDRAPAKRPGRGLAGALALRRVPGAYAIVERRADVPPVELGALQRHDAVVAQIAGLVPAILPVRFGTLLELDEIEDALREREDEIDEAFEAVRDRVQFTWRRVARRRGPASGIRRPGSGVRGSTAETGTEYLRRAARAARPAPPPAFKRIRTALQPFVSGERYQPATLSSPDALYHLVDRRSAARYRRAADTLAEGSRALRVTGPWAPFAFTPDLL